MGGATGDPVRTVSSRLKLRHVNLGCYLHSHSKQLPKWCVCVCMRREGGRDRVLKARREGKRGEEGGREGGRGRGLPRLTRIFLQGLGAAGSDM